jgi:mRNA-degrading endonuclease toxin of MazEF toxin-antitoxin module/DNA uptake protein ComE-like DNA-binding protein
METVVECKRGEMWYIRDGESFGNEMASRRAAVIISSDRWMATSNVVQVAYSTTVRKHHSSSVEVHSTKPWSWILCEQLNTVDKRRLMEKICDLTEAEMLKVELCLRTALGLSSKPSESDVLLRERNEKISDLESKMVELELELTVHKKLYEKAVDKIIELKFEKDSNREPTIVEKPPVEDKPFEVEESPKMEEPELDISGLAEKFKVYDERQKKVEKPVKKVGRPTAKSVVVSDKVNVNTADWRTLVEKVGMAEQTAKQLVAYRNKNGAFVLVTDLLKLPRITQKMFDRYFDLIEV